MIKGSKNTFLADMTDNDNKKENRRKALKTYARYSGLGFQLLFSIFLGFFVGQKIDEWVKNETPWFTILFIFLFFVASMVYMVKSLFKK